MFRIGKRLTAVLLAVLLFAVCISVLAGCDADEQTPEDTDHLPVLRYVSLEAFEKLEKIAHKMGFAHAAIGPLVRSSYHADLQAKKAGMK